MIRFWLLLCVLLLQSCSTSYVKFDETIDYNVKLKEKTKIHYSLVLKSNLSEYDRSYWEAIIVKVTKARIAKDGVIGSQRDDCLIKIDLHDDGDTYNSWKVWVSGLSLGLIPVKFVAQYDVEINNKVKRTKHQYHDRVETWSHIGIVPLFFLTTSKERRTEEIGSAIGERILKHCL